MNSISCEASTISTSKHNIMSLSEDGSMIKEPNTKKTPIKIKRSRKGGKSTIESQLEEGIKKAIDESPINEGDVLSHLGSYIEEPFTSD